MTFGRAFSAELGRISRSKLDIVLLTLLPFVLLGSMAAMLYGGSLKELPVVVVDLDGGPLAREIMRDIDASFRLKIVGQEPDFESALARVRTEDAVAILVIPQRADGNWTRGAQFRIAYQASFLSTGTLASTQIQQIVAEAVVADLPPSAGLAGLAAVDFPLPSLQVTEIGNPNVSMGWYLGLLLGPGTLHLVIAITCISALAPLLQDGSFARYAARTPRLLPDIAGRLTPHVIAGTAMGIAWTLWLILGQGYVIEGSIWIIALGFVFLFAATGAIAMLLLAITRTVSTSLSGAVIIAGSALAYSGASLPLMGANLFARSWSQVLPLTHYIALQMDAVIGSTAQPMLASFGVLLLYPLVAGTAAIALIRLSGRLT